MTLIKWLCLVIFSQALKYCVAWPLTPIIVLFAKQGQLPNWLSWFGTPDNSLDGDDGWRKESRTFLNENTKLKRYINRCFWLWRNTLYGFNHAVMSLQCNGQEMLVKRGTPNVSNGTHGEPGRNGFLRWYLYRNSKLIAFEWYIIYQWPFLKTKCLRILLGWKLWAWKPMQSTQCHVAFSPWILNKFFVK